jgi:hypothetical protein
MGSAMSSFVSGGGGGGGTSRRPAVLASKVAQDAHLATQSALRSASVSPSRSGAGAGGSLAPFGSNPMARMRSISVGSAM